MNIEFPIGVSVNNPLFKSIFVETFIEGEPVPPAGFKFLITEDGRYITTEDGRYIVTET